MRSRRVRGRVNVSGSIDPPNRTVTLSAAQSAVAAAHVVPSNLCSGSITTGVFLNLVRSYSDVSIGARQVLERNWREGRSAGGLDFGYTCPDSVKYPDQFFWDSCFHALAWS